MTALAEIVAYLDTLLETRDTPDYSGALNGLQLENQGRVRRIAAAVDFSTRAIDLTVDAGCDLLVVHHGMFWGGVQAIRGKAYRQLRSLLQHDVAVYASHLPLDRHPDVGNNALLARELGLEPAGEFGRYKTISVGVRGESDVPTMRLIARAREFAGQYGGGVRVAGQLPDPSSDLDRRRTRRWAICTGAGASSETIHEAVQLGIDTLIVGEGPHHTFVEAYDEPDLVVVYAGHYATETLGVRAVAQRVSERFGVPRTFIEAATGS